MITLYLEHAKNCLWCETRTNEVGILECCDECPRKDKENCPLNTDIGDSAKFYEAVVSALEKQIQKARIPSFGWKCPRCEQEFVSNQTENYCSKCGQAIKSGDRL